MAGRPTKYAPDRVKRILDALKIGTSRRGAAEYAGIDEDTLINWMKRYPDFSDSVTRVEAEVEADATIAVHKAWKDGDWKAAAFWLERRRNQDWGRKDRLEILTTVRELARAAGQDEDAAVAEAERYLTEMRRARTQG